MERLANTSCKLRWCQSPKRKFDWRTRKRIQNCTKWSRWWPAQYSKLQLGGSRSMHRANDWLSKDAQVVWEAYSIKPASVVQTSRNGHKFGGFSADGSPRCKSHWLRRGKLHNVLRHGKEVCHWPLLDCCQRLLANAWRLRLFERLSYWALFKRFTSSLDPWRNKRDHAPHHPAYYSKGWLRLGIDQKTEIIYLIKP